MDYNDIITELKKKQYHPVYVLTGEESYFIDMVSDYIEANVLDDAEKEFNQSVLYGLDVSIDDVIGTAKRFPMMSEHQVVIVKEAQNIRGLFAKSKSKEKSSFEAYLENPQESTILVICYKGKSIDKRTAIAKTIAKKGVLLESKKIYDNQVPNWINNYLKGKGFNIGPKAAALLTEYLGTSLSKISNELDKLTIGLAPKSEITVELIQKNIGISKDFNVFELQTAIGKKDVLKANRIVNYFAANTKEAPIIMTIASLYNYFCKILRYHFVSDKSKNNVASQLGIHPFFVGEYELVAKNFSVRKLKAVFSYLREYDLKSKGVNNVSATDGELLKELVFKLIH